MEKLIIIVEKEYIMNGYIYILKNNSYESSLLKIGKTTDCPKTRARALFSGATGIPGEFIVVFSYNVPDCHVAEKVIHKRLRTYRYHNKREFFFLSIKIAKKAIISTCNELFGETSCSVGINDESSHFKQIVIPTLNHKENGSVKIPIECLIPSPMRRSSLTDEQMFRISLLKEIFIEVFSECDEMWEGFSRDENPEREIVIWEHIAKSFQKISLNRYMSLDYKKEALDLLLMRSMMPTYQVLKEKKAKLISNDAAKEILKSYELRPKPLIVEPLKK